MAVAELRKIGLVKRMNDELQALMLTLTEMWELGLQERKAREQAIRRRRKSVR